MLRYIGFFLMLVDHVSFLYFPDFYLGRVIGRFSAPIFFYLLSEGYRYTNDLGAYLERLVKWALISQFVIWSLYDFERLPTLNILFTLAWCLVSLHIYGFLQDRFVKLLFFLTSCFLSSYFMFDYGWYAVASVFIFSSLRSQSYTYLLLNVISIFDFRLGFVQIFASPSYYLIKRFGFNWSRMTNYKINWYFIYCFHWVLLCLFSVDYSVVLQVVV